MNERMNEWRAFLGAQVFRLSPKTPNRIKICPKNVPFKRRRAPRRREQGSFVAGMKLILNLNLGWSLPARRQLISSLLDPLLPLLVSFLLPISDLYLISSNIRTREGEEEVNSLFLGTVDISKITLPPPELQANNCTE